MAGSLQVLNYTKEGGKIRCKYRQPEAKLCFLQCCLKVRITRSTCAHGAECLSLQPGGHVGVQYAAAAPYLSLSSAFHGEKTSPSGKLWWYPEQGTGIAGDTLKYLHPEPRCSPQFSKQSTKQFAFPFFPSSTVQKKHRWNTVWDSFAWDNRGISFSFSPSFCT